MLSKVMITKNLLYNAGNIIDNPSNFSIERFFDFSSFCEAAVLFDQLYALKSIDIIPNSSLLKFLYEQGILKEIRASRQNSDFSNSILKELLPWFLQCALDNVVVGQAHEFRKPILTKQFIDDMERDIERSYSLGSLPQRPLTKAEINWLDERARQNFLKEHTIRSITYLYIALANKVQYYPDYFRVPDVLSYSQMLYKSLPRAFYAKLASIFMTDLASIDEDYKSSTFPIPPITAIILEQAKTLKEIPNAIYNLRYELSSFRKRINELEVCRVNAATIKERLSLQKKKMDMFKEIAKHTAHPELVSIVESVDFFEQMLKPISSLGDPTSFSAAIFKQPVEWIKRWWIRRPITPLFRIDQKVRNIDRYEQLLQKFWSVRSTLLPEGYQQHTKMIQEILQKI